jgi:membrane protein YdbS with pleckstrin-like domain
VTNGSSEQGDARVTAVGESHAVEPDTETGSRAGILAPTAGAAFVLGAAGALLAIASKRAAPELAQGERVIVAARPRKALWRYIATAGLYELNRRTTYYAVTNRRVIVDHGLLHRTTHSLPFGGILDVEVTSGPLQGTVHVAEKGGGHRQSIGPLRTATARAFATALARALDD